MNPAAFEGVSPSAQKSANGKPAEPWHASSLLWTLNLDGMPLYVIRPEGPFAEACYERLSGFLDGQFQRKAERIAVPGLVTGQATLLNGQSVAVVNPDLRGLCNWCTKDLEEPLTQSSQRAETSLSEEQLRALVREFLDRIYYELRNAGRTPQERALNYAGTNLFEYKRILGSLDGKTALDTIGVERSQLCRPSSDCWDITLAFFDPEHPLQTTRKIYRYTIDVSDIIPVTVGETRSWSARVPLSMT